MGRGPCWRWFPAQRWLRRRVTTQRACAHRLSLCTELRPRLSPPLSPGLALYWAPRLGRSLVPPSVWT